tara:strand:- start:5764 stop:6111 length:348 start_codon:yes stop_codon:yes gene_type:complete
MYLLKCFEVLYREVFKEDYGTDFSASLAATVLLWVHVVIFLNIIEIKSDLEFQIIRDNSFLVFYGIVLTFNYIAIKKYKKWGQIKVKKGISIVVFIYFLISLVLLLYSINYNRNV